MTPFEDKIREACPHYARVVVYGDRGEVIEEFNMRPYTIEVTRAEAEMLAIVLANVGGHPQITRRRDADTLSFKVGSLLGSGFGLSHTSDRTGSIYFTR